MTRHESIIEKSIGWPDPKSIHTECIANLKYSKKVRFCNTDDKYFSKQECYNNMEKYQLNNNTQIYQIQNS